MSPEPAASIFAFTAGERLGLLGGQPDRPAPRALGAQGHRGGELAAARDAARREYRQWRDRVDDLRDQHHRGDLAGVAAGLRALRDDQVGAGRDLAARVLDGADECRHGYPAAARARSTITGGGGPSALAISRIGWRRATSISSVAPSLVTWCPDPPRTDPPRPGRHVRALVRYPVPLEDPGEELPVPLRDGRPQVAGRVRRLGDPAGDQYVDAVRAAAHVVIDPAQFLLEAIGGEGDRAEHAEAARVRDGGHDVAAVAEGEQRELDPERLADAGSSSAKLLEHRIALALIRMDEGSHAAAGPRAAWPPRPAARTTTAPRPARPAPAAPTRPSRAWATAQETRTAAPLASAQPARLPHQGQPVGVRRDTNAAHASHRRMTRRSLGGAVEERVGTAVAADHADRVSAAPSSASPGVRARRPASRGGRGCRRCR